MTSMILVVLSQYNQNKVLGATLNQSVNSTFCQEIRCTVDSEGVLAYSIIL